MRRMAHLLLLAVIIGSLHMSANAGEPGSDDYNDYDEDDTARSPGNLAKSTAAPVIPYFEQESTIAYVEPNATDVKIECPVKNYDAKRHSILWYREDVLIINGNQPIINIYKVESNPFVLIAPAANATGHSFQCRVMPSKVRHQITVQLGSPPSSPVPTVASTAALSTAVECLCMSLLITGAAVARY